jgi:hypothetical protein
MSVLLPGTARDKRIKLTKQQFYSKQYETCTRTGCYFHSNLKHSLDKEHLITIPEFIKRFGCASHSSINPDIILNNLYQFIENNKFTDPGEIKKPDNITDQKWDGEIYEKF